MLLKGQLHLHATEEIRNALVFRKIKENKRNSQTYKPQRIKIHLVAEQAVFFKDSGFPIPHPQIK